MTRIAEIQDLAAIPGETFPPDPERIVARIQWELGKVAVVEGATNQPMVAKLSRALPVGVYVSFLIDTDLATAVRDVDYELTGLGTHPDLGAGDYLYIPAGSLTGFINVNAIEDGSAEPSQFADIILQDFYEEFDEYEITLVADGSRQSSRLTVYEGSVTPGEVTWSFETDDYLWNEDTPPSSTRARVNFSEPIPDDVQMRFYTTPGTATGGASLSTPGADYVNLDATAVLPAGSTQFSIPLQIINDTAAEAAEDFTLTGEVLTAGSAVVDGPITTTTITINESDVPPQDVVAEWGFQHNEGENLVRVTAVEAGLAIRCRILISGPTTQNLFIPVAVVAVSGDLQRISLAFPGGVYGTAVVQAGQAFADILLTVPPRSGVQPDMLFTMTIGAATGVVPGEPSILGITVLDQGLELPVVSFRELVQTPINEGSTGERLIIIDVTNAAEADLSAPFSVRLAYDSSGGAEYGQDFRIYQSISSQIVESPTVVNFAANQTLRVIRLRPEENALNEPEEDYQITLVDPDGCTIGAIPTTTGTIIDNDAPSSGTQIRPQFYFASEVLGKGPNVAGSNQVNMIADLGPAITFNQDIDITVDFYSPNAVVSKDDGLTGDFWFPDGLVLRIPAGQRYGKLRFQALPDGVSGSLKWVVVQMVSTTFGEVDGYVEQCRWVAVLCGSADNEGLVPTPSVPSTALDDYEVYADRIEDLTTFNGVGPLTIPLPFPSPGNDGLPGSNTYADVPGLTTKYGDPNTPGTVLYRFCHFVSLSNYYNGPAIAAHLAQALWLDRNGGSLGTRRVYVDPNNANEVHYIDPAVPWLTVGFPVYISIYEQSVGGPSGGPHSLLFAGGSDSYAQRIATVNWGRGILTGTANLWHPSMTRDLYMTARGHDHIIKQLEVGAVLKDTSPTNTFIQAFTDNINLTGFRIAMDPTITSGGLVDAQQSVLGRQPPRFLTRQKLWHGLTRLHLWSWTTTTLAVQPTATFGIRVSNPGSWIVTNATISRTQRQWSYFDSTGPIFILAYNNAPNGTGRSLLQLVSRNPLRTLNPQIPIGGSSAGPSHGLVACVENEFTGASYGDASDFEIYGHLGYAFFVGNRHRGVTSYNRRLYTVLSSGNEEGMYIADAVLCNLATEYINPGVPEASPDPWFTARYVEYDKIDINIAAPSTWGNSAVVLSGCWRVVFRQMVSAQAITPMGGRSFFDFNEPGSVSPNYAVGAITVDALGRPIFGIGYTYPNPLPSGYPVAMFRNRGGLSNAPPGGISFPDGFDPSGLPGAYCGSTSVARHFLAISPITGIPLSAAARAVYDGRDPTL